MKALALLLALLWQGEAKALDAQKVKVFTRLAIHDHSIVAGAPVPATMRLQLKDPSLAKVIKNLKADDEVLLEGEVRQESTAQVEGARWQSVFVIEKIHPVSLQRLGRAGDYIPTQEKLIFRLDSVPGRAGMRISDALAGSIVMSATILLLHSLARAPGEAQVLGQLSTGLIFSAATLATGAQLYEDLKKN